MNKTTKAKLSKIVEEVLGVPAADDLSMDSVPGWDSLRHIQLLSKIEQAFEINIDFRDTLTMIDLRAIEKIVDKYHNGK